METGLFALLALAASERYLAAKGTRRSALVGAGLLLGLAALTRPEGALLFVLTAAHLVWAGWWTRGRGDAGAWGQRSASGERGEPFPLSTLTPLSILAGAFLALFLPYFLWRLSYYGDLLPNTFYAKTGGGLSQMLRGLQYAGAFALTLGGPLLLLIALPWRRHWREALGSWRGYLLLLVLVYSAYIVVVGGDHFHGERFFVPILPWIAILLADGLANLYGAVWRSSALSPRLSALLLALLLMVGSAGALSRTDHLNATIQGLDESVWIWREIGWWMADHAAPGASLAATGAGAPAFFGQLETIDLYGLTDKHIGRLEIEEMGQGVAGHEKRDPNYVLDTRRVSYIPRIWDDYFGGAAALRDRYSLITITTRTGRTMQLWKRNAGE
jgi:hypothetical protein